MSFELARKVADAVLYEGYVLYPYRASSVKNRLRWQFGVLAPRGYSEGGGSEAWYMQTECLVETQGRPRLDVRVRFLQVRARTVEEARAGGDFRPVDALEIDGEPVVSWEEGEERELDPPTLELLDLQGGERIVPFDLPGAREAERLHDASGTLRGRVIRERGPLSGIVRIAVEPMGGLLKVRIRIENTSSWPDHAKPDRDLALRSALVGTHTLLAVREGAFVSLLDPPWWAKEAASSCANERTWPVLVGPEGRRDVVLSSPIILYDHPAVAPESPGELCDSTEIDEILTLRVMTLTEEEKREARATDERARRIVERSDSMPPEILERLHGAMRSVSPLPTSSAPLSSFEAFLNPPGSPSPEKASLQIGDFQVGRGSRVRLRPSRRADSMDVFLAGRLARVEGVYGDLDEQTHIAVSLEDDPSGDLHGWIGRFYYFAPDEIEPLGSAGPREQARRE